MLCRRRSRMLTCFTQEPAAARTPALGSVMQPKAAAADRALESEAEALRKNPLKNYSGQE
jgi:hypothetical protein